MINDYEQCHKLYDSWLTAKPTKQKDTQAAAKTKAGKKHTTDRRGTGRRKQVERVKDELLHSWTGPKETGNKEKGISAFSFFKGIHVTKHNQCAVPCLQQMY